MIEAISTLTNANLTRSPAWQASFSIDGKYLAACFGNPDTHVKIWKCCNKSNKRRIIPEGDADKVVSSSTSGGRDGEEELEEWILLATIQQEGVGHTRSIRSVAFAPTSISYDVVPILATASFDGKVLIWEYCNDDDDDQNNIVKDAISSTGISNNNDDYQQSSLSCFEPIAQLEGHDNEIKDLAWNTTGSLLASCGRDKSIWIWECFLPGTIGGATSSASSNVVDDGEAFECLAVLQGHDGDIKSIAFGPSHSQFGEGEEILISASYDNTIKVWAEEAGDWYCALTLGGDIDVPRSITPRSSGGKVHTSTVWCVSFAPGGVRFFSGSDDGSIAIWKLYTATERKKSFPNEQVVSSTDGLWKCVGRLPDAHSSYAVYSIDCAPTRAGHGRIASAGGDNSINIYREESVAGGNVCLDAPKFSLEDVTADAHDGDVNCIKWHPRDGRCLVSCGDDGAVKLWRYKR